MQAIPDIGSILLGKYRVERLLGRGGMGFVVAVRHETLGELFAIKMMLPEVLVYDDARERFIREARALARLKGEHVARVHDVGMFEDGTPYMVMEHLIGEDLNVILDKRGVLPLDEAALYVHQACEAVAEAHGLGIAHRDLKPANMFLTRTSTGAPCVKVLDFGISKDVSADKVGPALTKTGMALGTPIYMAPEQLANTKRTDLRSDVWALGIILYELVTGKPPFYAEAVTELIAQVLTNTPTPPSQMRSEIPAAFDAVVLRCLEKKADQRFATVRAFMTALRPFMASATPSLAQTILGLQDPAMPSLSIDEATTLAIPKHSKAPPLPATNSAVPMLPTVPLEPNLALLGGQASSMAPSNVEGKPRGGSAEGGWGGTKRTFTKTGKLPWLLAAALGSIVLVVLSTLVMTTSTRPARPVTAASAVPRESAAPTVPVPVAPSVVVADKPMPTEQAATPPSESSASLPLELVKTPQEKPISTTQLSPLRTPTLRNSGPVKKYRPLKIP